MFDVPERSALAEMTDEALISAVTDATRTEASAAARRLALIAEVVARECDDEDDGIAHAVIDGWAWAQSQIAAACNLNSHAASKQMRIAQALRDRLPRTAALFARGEVSATVIDAITWRTHLVEDPDAIALIDAAIGGEATHYGTRSEKSLIDAVDFWVEKFDPAAVVRSRRAAKDLYVEFDDKDDPNGVSSFWGRLRVTDRKVLEQRLNDLADTVCANDPRRRGELRAAALATLGVVGPSLERLPCQCGAADCAGSGKDPRSGAVTIYVLADQVPDTRQDTPRRTRPGSAAAGPDSEPAEQEPVPEAQPGPDTTPAEPDTEPGQPAARAPSPGVMLDGAIIPTAMLAELIATGAKVKPLTDVAEQPAERQYRPSTTLTAFVRMRAMTCSFPGCSRPAHRCDLDHVTPWPAGATHPGNLAPLCRHHHLVKTFRTGPEGWTPHAQPDGTIAWTAPTGHTYTKAPGAAILFPHWNIKTSIPRKRAISLIHDHDRDTKMPVRKRTRAQDRAQRITAERQRNAIARALERSDYQANPPPF
ncbi:MAG: DUF222 domain-containing protein [Mycobacterium sp.]